MKYLPTAFAQLQFAWKLYDYALRGLIDRESLDRPITFQEEGMVLVLPDQIFHNDSDLILAIENNLTVAFGAAAITLNRSREETGLQIPKELKNENDHLVSLIYQIRNAFAHDIAEPTWEIRNPAYAVTHKFGELEIDLSNLHEKPFEYRDIGGPEVLFQIKDLAEASLW